MSLFLPVRNGATMAIATCDRCKRKRYYDDLTNDPNQPALRVCKSPVPGPIKRGQQSDNGCLDQFDPYRLAARQPEAINLQYPRPDADIATTSGQSSEYTWSYVGGTAS